MLRKFISALIAIIITCGIVTGDVITYQKIGINVWLNDTFCIICFLIFTAMIMFVIMFYQKEK